jgi:hypothetical protein
MSLLTMYKLHRLAELRYRYFNDLRSSERWQRYFTQEELDARVRETKAFADYWQKAIEIARVAAEPNPEEKPQAMPPLPLAQMATQRDADAAPLAKAS